MSPDSVAGKFAYFVRFEPRQHMPHARNVLLLGDSKMEWAFSLRMAGEQQGDALLHIVNGAIPGTAAASWYYLLKFLDPHRDRYDAVVIPLTGYRVFPWADDFADRMDTAQILAPFLALADWKDFIESLSDADHKWAALLLLLAPGHAFSADVESFLKNPRFRVEQVRQRYKDGADWNLDNPGPAESVQTLVYDAANNHVEKYPDYFTSFKRQETDKEFYLYSDAARAVFTQRNTAYMRFWLAKICDYYAQSTTRIIFVQMPYRPFPALAVTPVSDAADLRETLPRRSTIIAAPDDLFADLENPHYFYDVLHLNHDGKAIFSARLAGYLNEIMGYSQETRLRRSQ